MPFWLANMVVLPNNSTTIHRLKETDLPLYIAVAARDPHIVKEENSHQREIFPLIGRKKISPWKNGPTEVSARGQAGMKLKLAGFDSHSLKASS